MKILKKRVLFNNNYYDHIFILQFNNNLCYSWTMYFTKKRKIKIYIYMYAVAIKNKTFLKPYFIYCMKLGRKKKTTTRFAFKNKSSTLYSKRERERERRRSYIV